MPLKRAVTEFVKTYNKDRYALRTHPATSVQIFILMLGGCRNKARVTLSAQTMPGRFVPNWQPNRAIYRPLPNGGSTGGGTLTPVVDTSGFQNAPFWGVWSKTSAFRYVRRKTASQVRCNPQQPRAKRTTPLHVLIVTLHHAHNNFFFFTWYLFMTHM